jgi:hypothetical protein
MSVNQDIPMVIVNADFVRRPRDDAGYRMSGVMEVPLFDPKEASDEGTDACTDIVDRGSALQYRLGIHCPGRFCEGSFVASRELDPALDVVTGSARRRRQARESQHAQRPLS